MPTKRCGGLADPPRLLVLPGSRSGEIRRMAGVFGEALALIVKRIGAIEVVVPAVPRLVDTVKAAVASWPVAARVVADPADKDAAFRMARAALTKSGTSTFELALAGVPMVAGYRISLLEEVIGRLLIKTPSVILTNLILGENVVPEFLARDCTPEALADAILPLLADTPQRPPPRRGLRAAGRHHADRQGHPQRRGGRGGSWLAPRGLTNRCARQ